MRFLRLVFVIMVWLEWGFMFFRSGLGEFFFMGFVRNGGGRCFIWIGFICNFFIRRYNLFVY